MADNARAYNGTYTGSHLDRVAFPLGGLGAGMVCLEGTGAVARVPARPAGDLQRAVDVLRPVRPGVGWQHGAGAGGTGAVLEGPVSAGASSSAARARKRGKDATGCRVLPKPASEPDFPLAASACRIPACP